jgi:thiamine pyrophosphate-dependent acetolactate synthase large subunit-like protein
LYKDTIIHSIVEFRSLTRPENSVKYAEAFGATGLRIGSADEIVPVLTKALNTAGPVLVDIPIDYSHNQDLCAIVSENAGL